MRTVAFLLAGLLLSPTATLAATRWETCLATASCKKTLDAYVAAAVASQKAADAATIEKLEEQIAALLAGITPPPSTLATIRIHAGGAAFTDSTGTAWAADAHFAGGSTYTAAQPVTGTADSRLYQSERFGDFSYRVPVPSGDYDVTLHFAEVYWTASGQRVFDVLAEGAPIVQGLDLVARVGAFAPYRVTAPVRVTDGTLDLQFISRVDSAKVAAIEVTPRMTPIPTPTRIVAPTVSLLARVGVETPPVTIGNVPEGLTWWAMTVRMPAGGATAPGDWTTDQPAATTHTVRFLPTAVGLGTISLVVTTPAGVTYEYPVSVTVTP